MMIPLRQGSKRPAVTLFQRGYNARAENRAARAPADAQQPAVLRDLASCRRRWPRLRTASVAPRLGSGSTVGAHATRDAPLSAAPLTPTSTEEEHMSLAALKASRALWARREKHRKSRHTAALNRGDGAGIKKWGELLREARVKITERNADIRALSRPRIITSTQLGLRFQYLWGAKGAVTRGAWHYTAGPRAPGAAKLTELVRLYHGMHGGGLAYEAVIADDGTIALINPIDRKSAGVARQNTGMVNICCPGTPGDRLSDAQERSVRWLKTNWHTTRVPKAHRLPRGAGGLDWRGHQEHPGQSTSCPGAMLTDYKECWR